MFENYYKKSHFTKLWHFPTIFVLLKVTCLVTLFDRKLQVFKNSPKWTIFGIFIYLLSTQNVNVACFARNVEWDLSVICLDTRYFFRPLILVRIEGSRLVFAKDLHQFCSRESLEFLKLVLSFWRNFNSWGYWKMMPSSTYFLKEKASLLLRITLALIKLKWIVKASCFFFYIDGVFLPFPCVHYTNVAFCSKTFLFAKRTAAFFLEKRKWKSFKPFHSWRRRQNAFPCPSK